MNSDFQSKGFFVLAAIALAVTALQLYGARVDQDYRYNWDMLAYVGVALRWEGYTPEQTHQAVYANVRNEVPPAIYDELVSGMVDGVTGGKPVRQVLRDDASIFNAQLPFYSVKPIYPAAILLLHHLDLSPVVASGYISAAAFVGIVAVLLLWLRTFLSPMLALCLSAAIATHPLIFPQSYFPGPDSLSGLCIVATFALIARGVFLPALAIAAISVAVRPDDVLLLAAVSGIAWIMGRRDAALAGSVTGAAIFGAVLTSAQGYPWSTLFYHTFVARVLNPENFASSLTLADYVGIYWRNALLTPKLNPALLVMLLLGILTAVMRIQRAGWRDPYSLVAVAAALSIAAHWAIFPIGMPRHLFGFYIAILAALAKNLADAFAAKRGSAVDR